MEMDKLLHGEIVRELEMLKEMEVGSDKYEATVNGVTKLWDRALEHEKVIIDEEVKLKQLDEDKKDHWIKNGISALGIVVSTGLTIWGTKVCLKFEETGSITTMPGRSFINKLFSKK